MKMMLQVKKIRECVQETIREQLRLVTSDKKHEMSGTGAGGGNQYGNNNPAGYGRNETMK